mmetsp:Transcript_39171/g.111792  ORF Transcript_39171/g.111792 Transcript_39171/m.111792 type:complete len:221 (-) Transcript_39171:195-857(-)
MPHSPSAAGAFRAARKKRCARMVFSSPCWPSPKAPSISVSVSFCFSKGSSAAHHAGSDKLIGVASADAMAAETTSKATCPGDASASPWGSAPDPPLGLVQAAAGLTLLFLAARSGPHLLQSASATATPRVLPLRRRRDISSGASPGWWLLPALVNVVYAGSEKCGSRRRMAFMATADSRAKCSHCCEHFSICRRSFSNTRWHWSSADLVVCSCLPWSTWK